MAAILIKSLVFILGLCLGSFLNVVIYRLPRDDVTIRKPRRSACTSCGASIAWYDNLPLLSYLLLKGKCRRCGQGISIRYPIVELIAGLLALAVYLKSGISIRFFAELYFVLALIAITYIDLDEMIIPDALTLPGMVIGVGAAALAPHLGLTGPWLGSILIHFGIENFTALSVIGSVFGLAIGFGSIWLIFQIYFLIRKEEGIGGGDATLLGMVGAFLGWRAVFITIFFGSITALIAAVVIGVKEKEMSPQMKLPFGPFLSLAALIYLFFGEQILRWYLG